MYNKGEKKYKLIFMIIVMFFFFVGVLATKSGCDYDFHRDLADKLDFKMLRNPNEYIKTYFYPVWYFLVKIVTILTCQEDVYYGCQIVVGLCSAFVYLFVCMLYFDMDKLSNILAAAALCIVGPIYFPWFSEYYYLGQSSPNVWHNPTSLLLKPIALVTFWLLIKMLKEEIWTLYECFWLAFLLLIANLSKPSFSQILYPVIFIICTYRVLSSRGKYLKKALILLLCFLPSAICIIVQFFIAFYFNENSGGVFIEPFTSWHLYTKNIPLSVFLVICFPFFELIHKVKDKEIVLEDIFSWGMFTVAFLEYAFITEKGPRAEDGNFSWGYHLALFFVWIYAIKKYISDYYSNDSNEVLNNKSNVMFYIETIALLFHFMFGLRYIYTIVIMGNII